MLSHSQSQCACPNMDWMAGAGARARAGLPNSSPRRLSFPKCCLLKGPYCILSLRSIQLYGYEVSTVHKMKLNCSHLAQSVRWTSLQMLHESYLFSADAEPIRLEVASISRQRQEAALKQPQRSLLCSLHVINCQTLYQIGQFIRGRIPTNKWVRPSLVTSKSRW